MKGITRKNALWHFLLPHELDETNQREKEESA